MNSQQSHFLEMKIKHLEPCLLAHTYNSSTGEAEEEDHCKAPASQAIHSKTVQKGVKRDIEKLRFLIND